MLPETSDRLTLREFTLDDAPFMLALLTEPSWRRFIREHDVTTEAGARDYLAERLIPGYGSGLGFWLMVLRETGEPLGICGLIKRDHLDHPDLGFALLEKHFGQGYAREAAAVTIAYARDTLGLSTLLAISSPDNSRSHALLEHLGFVREDLTHSPEGQPSVTFRLALSPSA